MEVTLIRSLIINPALSTLFHPMLHLRAGLGLTFDIKFIIFSRHVIKIRKGWTKSAQSRCPSLEYQDRITKFLNRLYDIHQHHLS